MSDTDHEQQLINQLQAEYTEHGLSGQAILLFQDIIYRHYQAHGRKLPYRDIDNPYRILVSEIMLQQTQVDRVTPKYEAFIESFPDFQTLAGAPLDSVLAHWQGLGYNRRAKSLHNLARAVVSDHNGTLPQSRGDLEKLPGIGSYTASAILAFAYCQPVILIETNVRTVFIHLLFKDRDKKVSDDELVPLVEKTMDTTDSRSWYYALMDYGVYLKKSNPNPSRRSSHYQKQSKFEGSDRQIRGMVIKLLLEKPGIERAALINQIGRDPQRTKEIIDRMIDEGMVASRGKRNLLSIPQT